MTKELFRIASELKEPAYEVKHRKKFIIGALIGCVVCIGMGLNYLREFSIAPSFYESIALRQNQIILIQVSFWLLFAIWALLMAAFAWRKSLWVLAFSVVTSTLFFGIVVVTDSLGFNIFPGRGLVGAYIGFFVSFLSIPVMAVILFIYLKWKKQTKDRENQ